MPKILTLGVLIASAGGRLRMQTMRSTMAKPRPWGRKTERPNVVAVSVVDISYASPKGGRVPGYLATNGVVSLLTDGPVAEPGYVKDDYPLANDNPPN